MADLRFCDLLARQCLSGAFPSTVEGPDGPITDETCFVTAQVALILSDRLASPGANGNREALREAQRRALDFIETCAAPEVPGAFLFYPPEGTARLDIRLPADADDTALAWMALVAGGRRSAQEAATTLPALYASHCARAARRGDPPFVRAPMVRTWLDAEAPANPVDLIVNLNVLASLARAGVDMSAPDGFGARLCAGVAAALPDGPPSLSQLRMLAPFYAHPAELTEALSRAACSGVRLLAPALARIAPDTGAAWPDDDRPLYCNAHGRPVWRSPTLQLARRCRDAASVETVSNALSSSAISGGFHDFHAQIRTR
ncbi:hypothetical protein [Stappia sp. ES.058]|uniref:hypothetical protein n=1 Tax=Stappia sp. ES.058 TaxID=1881061 RepID=UPI000879E297|nr:hypothetical protein [Stappia sp. ES.058]SDU30618.1 hypothetical protein SAMN05428979_2869 [Stappia sp. ES.058]